MNKSININGEITEGSYSEFVNNLQLLNLQNGDSLDVYIDSVGGSIDFAKKMARDLQNIKKNNVIVNTIADGKVYSSAIVPFLYGDKKIINGSKNPNFLVHKVKMPSEDIDLSNVDKIKSDLERYTEELEGIYRNRGVSEEAIKHLAGGNDLIVSDVEEMKKYGLIDEVMNIENMKSFLNSVKKLVNFKNPVNEAKFSYVNKYEESEDLLTNNQEPTKTKINMEEFKDFMKKMEASLNQGLSELKTSMGNMDARLRNMEEQQSAFKKLQPAENEEISEQEWSNLRNQFRKTSVINGGKIKNVLHFANKCNEDDFMMPMDEEFSFYEEEMEDECLNLAGGKKFVNKKFTAKNTNPIDPVKNEPSAAVNTEPTNGEIDLINQLADENAPVTKAKNSYTQPVDNYNGIDKSIFEAFKGVGKYATGEHQFDNN